uniref:Murine leukemia virus integrase C-terminal domain-containing protein n=1 Tax=Gallus gallus TaxID=9031 RepID=A0A8V0XT04_CHICK
VLTDTFSGWPEVEIEQFVFGTRARGLGGLVHQINPGDRVYVTVLQDSLEPKWEGLFLVIMTTHTAVKLGSVGLWIHHTREKEVKGGSWMAHPCPDPEMKMHTTSSYSTKSHHSFFFLFSTVLTLRAPENSLSSLAIQPF